MNAISIKNVTKKYPGFTLGPVDLELPSGCVMGLVGENGAGKSTTIRLILNAAACGTGEISVLGQSTGVPGFETVKQDLGVVLDEAYFPEVLNAKHVAKILKNTYKNWDNDAFFAYLTRFSIDADKKFKDYSRGMRMKLALASALSHDAKLLILDEATSGLDPMAREELLELFNEFTREEDRSILLSSHIVSDLEKVCDYIAFLHQGKLLLCEEKDRLLERYALVSLPKEQLEDLPEDGVVAAETGAYGARALVLRDKVRQDLPFEHTDLEDIILFLAKGSANR
mgnify:CR=1 FL=1